MRATHWRARNSAKYIHRLGLPRDFLDAEKQANAEFFAAGFIDYLEDEDVTDWWYALSDDDRR